MHLNNPTIMNRVVLGVAFVFFPLMAGAVCPDNINVYSSKNYRVVVDSNSLQRTLKPSFFGFNLEWVSFQGSLWDDNSRQVRPEVVKYLRPFEGAVYRYPGGVPANISDWRDLTGSSGDRPSRKYASWSAPFKNRFGLDEYLDFLARVNGQGWYILNLDGHYGVELTDSELSAEVKAVTDYFNRQHEDAGKPEIIKWELSNELDRYPLYWVTEKIIDRSLTVADALPAEVSKEKLVSMLEEYSALEGKGISATSFNSDISSILGGKYLSDYSMHLYYDGDNKPQPPVPWFIRSVCNAQSVIESRHPDDAYSIWITEHARVPVGAFMSPDWKTLWPQTANQQAAISVADMMIAMAKNSSVKGLFIHSIHGDGGPWPLFHEHEGVYYPSVVFLALKLLRESMLENVLYSVDYSKNESAYIGGYDVRSLFMANNDKNKFSAWLINRSDSTVNYALSVPGLSGKDLQARLSYISSESTLDSNYSARKGDLPIDIHTSSVELDFDDEGSAIVKLEPNSVSTIIFDVQ